MLNSILIGLGGIVFLTVMWGLVQFWWKDTFAEYLSDEDVLADRRSCGNCGCTTACERKTKEAATK